jgi:hypothetical protein
MNRIIRKPRKEGPRDVKEGDAPFDSVIEPRPEGDRFKLLPWLAGAIFIFALLYCSSYVALLWLPPYAGMDMKSQLVADYSAWTFVVFQPVDPAVIEEIKQERGLPEQMIVDGGFWPTPTTMLTMPPTARYTPTSTPRATVDNLPLSPTASQPTYPSTPMPTSIIVLPEATVTLRPAETSRPHKTPRSNRTTPKPRRTPKP